MEDFAGTIRLRKAGQAALVWLKHCKNHDLTNLYKFIYYLDFSKAKKTGKPFFNFRYRAAQFGPIPVEVEEAIKAQAGPLFETLVIRSYQGERGPRWSISAKSATDETQDLLSNAEKSHLEQICYLLDQYTATDLSGFTHAAGDPWDRVVKTHGLNAPIDILEALTMSGFEGGVTPDEAAEKLATVHFLEASG